MRTLLLLLIGVAGALGTSAPRPPLVEPSRAIVARPDAASTADADPGGQDLALVHEVAAGSSVYGQESRGGPGSTDPPSQRAPLPRRGPRSLPPGPRTTFRPGERPAALAFLLVNGSADAHGART